ncbi:MAG: hypothetical protein M3N08_02665 [Pseudomonadota bacterium]|nr:hypothetical protein [Pseudomonadota bacterium]
MSSEQIKPTDSSKFLFVIEAISRQTGSIVDEFFLEAESRQAVCQLVEGIDAEAWAKRRMSFDIGYDETEREEAERLAAFFNLSIDLNDNFLRLGDRSPLDDFPYKVHTNRELKMMLEGNKPLSAFCDVFPANHGFEVIPERYFDPYVSKGVLIKQEHIRRSSSGRDDTRMVLYATPKEEWRIKAYILLWETVAKAGWNEGFERMEGSLLGYEEWQNDWFIENRYRRKPVASDSNDK